MKKFVTLLWVLLAIAGSTLHAQEVKKERSFLSIDAQLGLTTFFSENVANPQLYTSYNRPLSQSGVALMYGTQARRFGVGYSYQEVRYPFVHIGGVQESVIVFNRAVFKMSHYAPITKNFFFATDTGFGYANERIKDPINGSIIHHGIALELGAHFAYNMGNIICRIGMQYELATVFGVDRGGSEKGKGFISSFAPQLSFTIPLWTR